MISFSFKQTAVRSVVGLAAVVLMLIGASVVQAQVQVGEWTAHTAMREVVALSPSNEAIWAATTGGVFSYNPDSGEIQRFTAAEGLYNVQTEALAYDERRNAVWIGYRDGVIDRLDVETGEVRTFFDIQRNDRLPSREINRLVMQGDSLLVAAGFGLVVFDPVRQEVRDTYSQLGTLPPTIAVHDVVVAPLPGGGSGFWLVTDEGIAYAPRNAVNLQDPSSWTVEMTGLAAPGGLSAAYFGGRLYVGTEQGLAVREAADTYSLFGATTRPAADMAVTSDHLLFTALFSFLSVDASGAVQLLSSGFNALTAITVGPGGNIWIGDREAALNGFLPPAGGTLDPLVSNIAPAGPFDGLFGDLTIDDAGNLWTGAIRGVPRGGFYRLDPEGTWTSFTGRFFEELENTGSTEQVHVDSQGNLWGASLGSGLAQHTPDGEIIVYGRSNSSLRSDAPTNPDFIPVTGVSSDADGTLWVANRAAPNTWHVRTTDGNWTALDRPSCPGLPSAAPFGEVYVDSFGNKWIVVISQDNFQRTIGLIILDTGASATDSSDDTCRFINQQGSSGSGLPSVQINGLTEDREGRIWLATDNGPAFMTSSTVIAQDNTTLPIWPQWSDRSQGVFVLGNQVINGLAIDPSNRVWMATSSGAYLVQQEANGYAEVEHYTTETSPLFSDNVVAITVNEITGD
ncbi:MAG TPA: two-component regulator propeller domain-containing protein, partial [Rhodothermales bacterium]|nr:two-component regulator propeller domain-containing protein [Rhodothermales bacterium]